MRLGKLFIYSTKNNSIITLTTANDRTRLTEVAGKYSPNDRSKSSVYYFLTIYEKICQKIDEDKFTHLICYVRSKGGNYFERFGPGLAFLLRKLKESQLNIYGPIRNTPIPHGGTKKPYGRRGRRK